MGPDSFLTDIHSLVNAFREDRACGAREVGIRGTANWHVPFFSSLNLGPAIGCPAPSTQSSGEGPRPVRRGAPRQAAILSCAISSIPALISRCFPLFPAPP